MTCTKTVGINKISGETVEERREVNFDMTQTVHSNCRY